MEYIENLESDCSALHIENALLSSELQSLKKCGFMSDPNKVCYFTGLLSADIVHAIFQLVSTFVPKASRSAIPLNKEFLMVLMK